MEIVAKKKRKIDPVVKGAQSVFKKAKADALARGCTVITLEGTTLYRIEKNGKRQKLKEVEAFINIPKGTRFSLK
jgi:hypothetical protein